MLSCFIILGRCILKERREKSSFFCSYLVVLCVVVVCFVVISFDFVVCHIRYPHRIFRSHTHTLWHVMHKMKRSIYYFFSLFSSHSLHMHIHLWFTNRIRTWLRRMKCPTLKNHIIVAICSSTYVRLYVCVRVRVSEWVCVCGNTGLRQHSLLLFGARHTVQHTRSFGFGCDTIYSKFSIQHEQHQVTIKDHSTYSNCFIQW